MIQNHFRFVCSNFHYVKICQIFLNFWKIPHFVFFLLLCKHWNLFQSANMNPFLCSKWKGTFKIFQKSATVNDVRILHFVEKHKQPGQLLMFLVSLAGHQWSKLGVRTETVVFVAIITDPPVFLPVFEKSGRQYAYNREWKNMPIQFPINSIKVSMCRFNFFTISISTHYMNHNDTKRMKHTYASLSFSYPSCFIH